MRCAILVMAAAALGTGLAVLAAGLALAGYDAIAALAALWSGAFGSWYAFTSATLVRAVPLIVIGLGIALAFRAGALQHRRGRAVLRRARSPPPGLGLHAGGLPPALAILRVWLAAR